MTRLNVGNLDRLLRVLAGIGLIALAATGVIGAWGYIGLVPAKKIGIVLLANRGNFPHENARYQVLPALSR